MNARLAAPSSSSTPPELPSNLLTVFRPWRKEYLAALELLSFTRSRRNDAEGRNFWAPPAITDINQQWVVGDAFGREALRFMSRYEAPTGEDQFFLGHVVAGMIAGGSKTGVELGFARAIARAAIRGMVP